MNDPYRLILGDNIRRLRKALDLNQAKFAEHADIDWRHFQDIEAGKVDVGFDILRKIHRALGCDWNTLMEGIDEDGAGAMELAAARAHA